MSVDKNITRKIHIIDILKYYYTIQKFILAYYYIMYTLKNIPTLLEFVNVTTSKYIDISLSVVNNQI